MTMKSFVRGIFGIGLLAFFSASLSAADQRLNEQNIWSQLSHPSGLVVQIGGGEVQQLATFVRDRRILAHVLCDTPTEIGKARAFLGEQELYGKVMIEHWPHAYLPYVDNIVNVLIVAKPGDLTEAEMKRCLAPLGVAWVRDVSQPSGWRKIVKPWPDDIDEWTHYLHDPTNNAVAHDTAIGPLRHLQWEAAPRYSRHHEYTSSVAAVVSAQGRMYSIMDMGSRASIHLPAKWSLCARDAFNGLVLWERPVKEWFNHLWPLKDGPAQPPRRLVAVDDKVYVTLSLDAPVSQLDGRTGEIRQTYEDTQFTEEILCDKQTLFLLGHHQSMNPRDYYPRLMICWDEKNRTLKESEGLLLKPEPRDIKALDCESGELLWEVSHPVEPLTLAVDDQYVYFHNWERIISLDRRTGKVCWRSDPVVPRKSMGYVYGPTLVVYDDVVLFADGRQKRTIFALSKKDGSLLWQAPHYPAGHAGSPEDLMVVDGLVWCGNIASGKSGKNSGLFTGRHPVTGEVVREFTPNVDTYWFHHRCYRAKATDEYILTSRTGIEFVDVRSQDWETHHWVRGACTYGILPCNGLIYSPPHPCACYLDTKLSGFNALAPARNDIGGGQRQKGRSVPAWFCGYNLQVFCRAFRGLAHLSSRSRS